MLFLLTGIIYTIIHSLLYTTIFFSLLFILLIIEIVFAIKNRFSFYDKTLQAILNEDFSADYSKIKDENKYKSLISVYEKLKGNKQEIVSKEFVYNSILNGVDTGVLILKKNEDDWEIPLLNEYFSTHLNIPKVTKWKYLKKVASKFCDLIEQKEFADFKQTLQIKVENQELQTFVVQLSNAKVYDNEFVIIFLESVQKLVDKKEKEAWVNLMNVISHELLNSLTPIQSLSQNIYDTFSETTILSEENFQDIKDSAYTMVNRSNHLRQFIEGYRKLAMLPSPNKKLISLEDLVVNCIRIMKPILSKEKITIENKIDFNRKLLVDEKQIEQVIINLLTNCMYALEEEKLKRIIISSEVKSNRLLLHISDNGKGVAKEIKDKIFTPFFTTRQGGGGIGLALSKNILEAHNGYLIHNNENNLTTFTLAFLQ